MAREKMTGVDTAWLRMDSPANLMMIVGVEIFDTPIAYDALAQRLTDRFLTYDRFRQKVVAEGGGYCWEDDEDFDMDWHVRLIALPGRADKMELERAVSELLAANPEFRFENGRLLLSGGKRSAELKPAS